MGKSPYVYAHYFFNLTNAATCAYNNASYLKEKILFMPILSTSVLFLVLAGFINKNWQLQSWYKFTLAGSFSISAFFWFVFGNYFLGLFLAFVAVVEFSFGVFLARSGR